MARDDVAGPTAHPTPQSRRRAMSPKHILLVDDEDDIREVAALSLEAVGGWRVSSARDGASGVAMARAERPDAILLDVMMPGLDGPATVARLREDPLTRDIPVILLTAKAQTSRPPPLRGARRRRHADQALRSDDAHRSDRGDPRPREADPMSDVSAGLGQDLPGAQARLRPARRNRRGRGARRSRPGPSITRCARAPSAMPTSSRARSGTFGLQRGTELARELETTFAAGRRPVDADRGAPPVGVRRGAARRARRRAGQAGARCRPPRLRHRGAGCAARGSGCRRARRGRAAGAAPRDASKRAWPATDRAADTCGRILVVDDDEAVRDVLVGMLERGGLRGARRRQRARGPLRAGERGRSRCCSAT